MTAYALIWIVGYTVFMGEFTVHGQRLETFPSMDVCIEAILALEVVDKDEKFVCSPFTVVETIKL